MAADRCLQRNEKQDIKLVCLLAVYGHNAESV